MLFVTRISTFLALPIALLLAPPMTEAAPATVPSLAPPPSKSSADRLIPTTGSITVVKQANPESSQVFSFVGDLGAFTLVDDGTSANTRTFTSLNPGQYSIGETLPAGWELTSSGCVGLNERRIISTIDNPLSVSLGAAEQLTCTFAAVDRRVDLSLTKELVDTGSGPGTEVEYEIIVRNDGPGHAQTVAVLDSMPGGLENPTWRCTAQGSGALCDNGNSSETGTGDLDESVQLAAGTSIVYAITATIADNPPPIIDNFAELGISDAVADISIADNADSARLLPSGSGGAIAVPLHGPLGRALTIALLLLCGCHWMRRVT